MKIKNLLLATTIFLISSFAILDINIEKLVQLFNNYFSLHKTFKIYLHTDGEKYRVNENIWFAAYLLNADNTPDSLNENIYVELINDDAKILYVKLLKLNNGLANGDFFLPDSLNTGYYQLRSYVNFMKNYSYRFFFTKTIYIENYKLPEPTYTDSQKNKKHEDFNVEFFPEMQNFIDNTNTKVAVKITSLHEAKNISICIKDDKNNIVVNYLPENKISSFYFKPEIEKKYKASVTYNGDSKKMDFAEDIKKYGFAISCNTTNSDNLEITITKNLFENNDQNLRKIYLLAQQNNTIKYKTIIDTDNETLKIPKNIFTNGIAILTFFNHKQEYIGQRLVFIKNNIAPPIETTHRIENNKLLLEIMNKDSSQITNLSIAVVPDTAKYQEDNILSYLLLTSELNEFVENANTYLEDYKQTDDLDLIMLTTDYKRYTWNNIFYNSTTPDSILFPIDKGISIGGRIKKLLLDLPSKNTTVNMTILNAYNDAFTTYSDKRGRFNFDNLYYSDSIEVMIEATTQRNRDNVLVCEDQYDTIPVIFNPAFKHTKKSNTTEDNHKDNKTQEIHGKADQTIYADQMNTAAYSNVFNLLNSRVPGLNIRGNSANIRNTMSLRPDANNQPLYLIDNIPTDASAVESLNINDIERIEILKSTSKTAIYGGRGRNGVIAIYTKKGYNVITGWTHFKRFAYYSPKEFVYNNSAEIPFSQKTLFWKPNISIANKKNVLLTINLPENNKPIKIILQGITEDGQIIYKEFMIK